MSVPPVGAFYSSRNELQMALDGWGPGRLEPHRQQAHVRRISDPFGEFCDRGIDAMIDHAIQMQTDDPAQSEREDGNGRAV